MEYEYSNKAGKFKFIHTLDDGEGIRITNRLLKSVVIETANNSYKYIDGTELIPPFAYKEKQVHTVLAPAIKETAEYFLMESPVNRVWSGIDSSYSDKHGWVDYWLSYKNYDYYMEVKHGFRAYNSSKVRDSELEKWNQACNQLNTLVDEISEQKQYSKGIFKVAFHIMPVYLNSIIEEKLTNKTVSSEEVFEDTIRALSRGYEVNWGCIWELSNDIDKVHEFVDRYERYPYVMFFAHVYELEA